MIKPTIKQVIVVEGRDDTRRLQEIFDVQTIETNGSAINAEIITRIKMAHELHGVIVFTDPDTPGMLIRNAVTQAIPAVAHAFLEQDEARPTHKGSLGVEHASDQAISHALASVYTIRDDSGDSNPPAIDQRDLIHLSLIGTRDAKARREYLAKTLRIGYVNGKQLLKRLKMFQISKAQVEKVMADFDAQKDSASEVERRIL